MPYETTTPAQIDDSEEPSETPEDLAIRWGGELAAATDQLKHWWERTEKIVKRYLDDRQETLNKDTTRLNLFTANTQTMEALLFGKTPQVDVARRYADSQDDVARVASEMLERLLNTDIERDDDTQQDSMRASLSDRLIAGLGNVKLRYDPGKPVKLPGTAAMVHPQTGAELAPAVPDQEQRPDEDVCVDYCYWKDQLWSPCRVFRELRWWAFKAEMSRKQLIKRFGKEIGKVLPMNTKSAGASDDVTKVKDHLQRCDVWEIWSKDDRKVYWLVQGYDKILDQKDDPLGLEGFWPFPKPMFANLTTSKLMPTPDFALAQDLYDEIDNVSSRILLLEQCVRVAGVYDKSNEELKRLVNQTAQNELIATEGWQAFAEKGGVKGSVDWLPMDMIVQALDTLRNYRTELIQLLFQVTGMSDIMRGQASQQTTATEQAIKARFASVRVQTLQDEFARFASDVQKIKAEIISKHFQPQTIIERSNIMRTPDAQMAEQAVQLIQSDFYQWRVSVNPDSISLTDFAALKQERFEWMQTLSGFFQQAQPVAMAMPGALPFLLEIAQWTLAGLKGSNTIEGVFDQAIAAFKKQQAIQQATPPQPPPPDPKVISAQIKARGDIAKTQAAQAGRMQEIAAETRADILTRTHDATMTIAEQEARDRRQGLQDVSQATTPSGAPS